MSIWRWLQRRRLDLDDEDFSDEIRAHLAIAEQEKMADGADPEAARYAALKEFGNVALTTDATRRVWMPSWLEALRDQVNDVRYAIRALRKHKGFSLTVIAVLTLGIGLNAAVFTMLKGMVLTPLSGVADARRLVAMFAETGAGRLARLSYPDYTYLRDRNDAFADLFGTSLLTVNLGRGRNARQISAEAVTGNYFDVLGIPAALGRTIRPFDEARPGGRPVVVLSESLWRTDFNRDPDIVGRTVEINTVPFTVVGVAGASFRGTIVTYDIEAFVPVTMLGELGITGGLPPGTPSAAILADPGAAVLFPHGYLRSGATVASAAAETAAIWSVLTRDRPLADAVSRLRVVPFWQSPVSGGQTYILPTLVVLSAMGLLVLLIACANIAGLVLVRGVSRRGEIAVRLALGATRRRILRLLIVENLVLAIPGAILGVVLARRSVPVLFDYAEWLAAPQRIFFNTDVDALVLGFAALVAVASALVFGFVPALQSTRVDLVSVINEDASPRGAARGRLRSWLVVAQVAVSVLLLVGALLATRSVAAARRADPGYDASLVASVDLDVRLNGYDEAQGRSFYRALLERVRADNAIESATLAIYHPLTLLDTRVQRVEIEDYEPRRGEDVAFMFNVVARDYFRTLRIPMVAGRAFEDRDDEHGAPVAIVNRTLAERFWGDARTAVGRRLRDADGRWRAVIGVAADVKYTRIDAAPRPYFYLPHPQAYRSRMALHARTSPLLGTGTAAVHQLVARTRAHVEALDANLPILHARPMEETTRGAFIFFDLTATMLFLFGAVGVGLAVMGTYGLVAYVVRQSTREIGIRLALGASGPSVVRGFAARGLRLGAIGAVLGILAALGVSRLLGSVLYGVSPTDLPSFGGALGMVLGGVVLATIVPAWRAARTDALSALRHQ